MFLHLNKTKKLPNGINGRRFCMSLYEVNGICQTLCPIEKVETSSTSFKCEYRNRYHERIKTEKLKIMFLNNSNCKDSDERITLCEKDINSNDEIIMKQV